MFRPVMFFCIVYYAHCGWTSLRVEVLKGVGAERGSVMLRDDLFWVVSLTSLMYIYIYCWSHAATLRRPFVLQTIFMTHESLRKITYKIYNTTQADDQNTKAKLQPDFIGVPHYSVLNAQLIKTILESIRQWRY